MRKRIKIRKWREEKPEKKRMERTRLVSFLQRTVWRLDELLNVWMKKKKRINVRSGFKTIHLNLCTCVQFQNDSFSIHHLRSIAYGAQYLFKFHFLPSLFIFSLSSALCVVVYLYVCVYVVCFLSGDFLQRFLNVQRNREYVKSRRWFFSRCYLCSSLLRELLGDWKCFCAVILLPFFFFFAFPFKWSERIFPTQLSSGYILTSLIQYLN